MKRRSVVFAQLRHVEVIEESLADELGDQQVLVETILSAISPGTETLIYRGEAPDDLAVDDTLTALKGSFGFPIKYGYSVVGRVIQCGASVDRAWLGKRAFAFNPHETHFAADTASLLAVPEDIETDDAVFLPNMESAVNFVMDGRLVIGEKVVVFGQGIVGLLTTALLAKMPLTRTITLDRYLRRREASLGLGVEASLDPDQPDAIAEIMARFGDGGADLVFELSGAPAALDQAIRVAGFAGRIVIGSWYGQKPVALALGGKFHRSRLRLISSQVSTVNPDLSGRWDKARRFNLAWDAIRSVHPARFITHRVSLDEATQAYDTLDRRPQDALQIIFQHGKQT